jgi:Icc-related predicted phosphoesterase
VHIAADSVGTLAPALDGVSSRADVLLLAGDLTKCGTPDEARLVVDELRGVSIPMIAVLGNHDHHDGRPGEVATVLHQAGIEVLEGTSTILDLPSGRLGVAGVKGFGGGFAPSAITAFGEAEMKAFVYHTEAIARRLGEALADLAGRGCNHRIALLHYSPVVDTLEGERPEIHAFLGSQLLAEAIDHAGADLALHGHAHAGTEHGSTAGGVPVRNVAMPVIRTAYRVFTLGTEATVADQHPAAH